jgi:hypothetical protein
MWEGIIGKEYVMNGLWCDEWTSSFPVFALLDKNEIQFDVYSDVDIHNMNPDLLKYKLLIFYGQEGITSDYYRYLKKISSELKIPMIFLCVQGFGYRQYNYDSVTGELAYICTRGKHGIWGDILEDQDPVWKNEGELFGFQFPEPDPFWGYNQYTGHLPGYSKLKIINKKHWLIQESGITVNEFIYFMEVKGQRIEGLTGLGGEIQRKFKEEAEVIACLGDDTDIVGIGEYNNILIFSPTYWPIYFAYQQEKHPEVEKLIITAIRHFVS